MADKMDLTRLGLILRDIKKAARHEQYPGRIDAVRRITDAAIFEIERLKAAQNRPRSWWTFWRAGK